MSTLLIVVLTFFAVANSAAADLITSTANTNDAVVEVAKTNAPVDPAAIEEEFKKLEINDDIALAEIDRWIQENAVFAEQGAGVPNAELNARIRRRLDEIRKAYDDFIQRNPRHSKVRLAYASFLHDIGEEETSRIHLETARDLDPSNPAVWNNLANYYGHRGSVTNAFTHYEKAIELDPSEPVYYHNFGTTVFLFRKDVREFYGISEQQVFDKAMALYSNSMRLDPTNFLIAADVAKSYYGIRPWRTNDALQAWTNALKLAGTEQERQGVFLHLARVKIAAGQLSEAREHLNQVSDKSHEEIKTRLLRNLTEREQGTNAPAAAPGE